DSSPVVSTWVPWWALVPVFYFAEAYVIHVQFRREAHTISLSEGGLVVGLYLLSPGGLLAATVVGVAAALVFVRRQRAAKLVFNRAQLALATAVGLLVFRSVAELGDPFGPVGWLAAMLAVLAASVTGIALVTLAIEVAEGSVDPRLLA